MAEKQELLKRIEALELSRAILDEEIARERAALEKLAERTVDARKVDKYLQTRATKKLAEFFDEIGYAVTELRTGVPDDVRYTAAKLIWGAREKAVPFLKQVYAGKEFDWPQAEMPTSLGQAMQSRNWIGCEYRKKEKLFHVQVHVPKELKVFINGGWAEEVNRFLILKTLAEYAAGHKIKYKVFWDVRLKLRESENRNANDMQLDIVAQIKDRFYIFETKSGACLDIRKWVLRAERFNRPERSRYITCSVQAVDPKYFRPFVLMTMDTLEKQFPILLERDLSGS